MASIYGYSATAASNTSSAPDGAPEGMAPSGVNDTIRKVMANLAEFAIAQVAGGTADALTLTPTNTLAAYVDGMQVHFRAASANATTTPSLAISGLTARIIYKNGGSALVANDIAGALAEYIVRYNLANTRWELLNPGLGNIVAASDTVQGKVELATTAETVTGADTARAVTPAGVAAAAIYQGKHTIWIPSNAMISATTNGPSVGTVEQATNKNMTKTLDFDATTSEIAQFHIAFPKSWNLGTVTFIPHWTAASGSGTFISALSGVAISNDDALDVAFGTAQSSTDTLITAYDNHVGPESAAITIAGTPAVGDLINFKIIRDVADTLGVDAKLIGILIIYTVNAKDDA
jgi:hypothetical protein